MSNDSNGVPCIDGIKIANKLNSSPKPTKNIQYEPSSPLESIEIINYFIVRHYLAPNCDILKIYGTQQLI